MSAFKEFIDKGFKDDVLPFHNELVLHREKLIEFKAIT